MSTAKPLALVARMIEKNVVHAVTFYIVQCPCKYINKFNALKWANKKQLPCAKCGLLISKETMEATKG